MEGIADVSRMSQEAIKQINESAAKFMTITADLKEYMSWFKTDSQAGRKNGDINSAASANHHIITGR